MLLGLGALPLCAEVSKETQIKAAFLFNFTKFVEWPQECFADDTSPLVIAVLGTNQFGDELRKVVQDRKVNGRDIVVTTVTSLEAPRTIHLLFVDARGEAQFRGHLGRLRAAGVLTVGESDQFIAGGGIIAFTLVADKVRFEINQTAAEQARLKLRAQLLKLATAVHRQPGSSS
jgi:hypothetical protein